MDSDRTRWDDRYRDCDLTEPAPPEALDGLDVDVVVPTEGRALDVACGTGAQSLWLAQRGLDVVALDVSPRAIELVGAAAAELGPSGTLDARVHDLDTGLPADLAPFDVVVCQRFRDVELYRPLVEILRRGGLGVVTVLSQVGAADPGAFHAPPGELDDAFAAPAVDVLHRAEADGVASIVFRRN